MKYARALTLSILALLIASCGGSGKLTKRDGCKPDWFLNPPVDSTFLYASAMGNSKDLQMALTKAEMVARRQIGSQLETKLNALQKKFNEEVGSMDDPTLAQSLTVAIKTTVSTVLHGSKIIKKDYCEKPNSYEGFILMKYPLGQAYANFVNQVKKKKELETRFRAFQGFQELEKEVEKFEREKRTERF